MSGHAMVLAEHVELQVTEMRSEREQPVRGDRLTAQEHDATILVRHLPPLLPSLHRLHRIVVSNEKDQKILESRGITNCSVIPPGIDISGLSPSPLPLDRGLTLLMASKFCNVRFSRALVRSLPLYAVFLAAILFTVFYPEIVLWLPKTLLPESVGCFKSPAGTGYICPQ